MRCVCFLIPKFVVICKNVGIECWYIRTHTKKPILHYITCTILSKNKTKQKTKNNNNTPTKLPFSFVWKLYAPFWMLVHQDSYQKTILHYITCTILSFYQKKKQKQKQKTKKKNPKTTAPPQLNYHSHLFGSCNCWCNHQMHFPTVHSKISAKSSVG